MTSVFGPMSTGRKACWILCALMLSMIVGSGASVASITVAAANHALPAPAVHKLSFSAAPTDAEFLHTGLFAEPLAPVATTNVPENRDLAKAVLAYRNAVRAAHGADAVQPLLDFLSAHPNSPWKPALQLNLGLIYRQTGHFSKALAAWQEGWHDTQPLTDREGEAIANAILAYLSQTEAYLGRTELLRPLLASIGNRPIGGTAAQLITDSHTGLYRMTYQPQNSFRCGPLALLKILRYHNPHPSAAALQVLELQSPSTNHGLSLTMVQEIARRAGMSYQMAYRSPGAPIIFPAVVHWNVGHYAAIVARDANGHYIVQDTTFGEDLRVSAETLNEESSGYFLVPDGPLPTGWRSVSAKEGSTIWGRGDAGTDHDPGATGSNVETANSKCNAGGCTTSTVELEVVGLQLDDHPVGYTPPIGPAVKFQMVYSHRDMQQPSTFSYTNFGPKWTFNWLSYVTDAVNSTASATLYVRGGGSEPFTFSSTSATTSYPGPYSQSTLTRTVDSSGDSTSFTLTHPDGSFEEYTLANGSLFFMTAVGDKAGKVVTLTYDGSMRITKITDAIGQVTTLTYGLSASPLVVTAITDPFGRSATFTYNSSGLLASITDVLGITSSYTYGQGSDPDFINTLTTPYGSTTFTYGDSSTNPSLGLTRFVKTVDPLGRTSYVEYDWTEGYVSNAIPSDVNPNTDGDLLNPALVPAGMSTCAYYLQNRNTFIFDANQYQLATASGTLNYADAKVIHWLHTSDATSVSRVKESEKEPLENRVWYNYANQSGCLYFPVTIGGVVTNGASNQPTAIGRVLDSGTTQLQTFQYNAQGNVTVATDPIGRQTTYTYASNGIDRLTTTNTTGGADQTLETRTYNSQHLPLTVTAANGRTAHYQYNAAGQLTRYTDPTGHATALTYDGSGHLESIQGPISGDEYSFAYDNVGRIAATTDPAGSTIRYTYDAADRPTGASFPDGTHTQLTYHLLDLASVTDRLGQTTDYSYDADRELIETIDPLGQTVQQGYNPAGTLDSLTDANGHTTTFQLDAQSRVIAKQYPDGTTQSIAYENGKSLVAQVTDALNQSTVYVYNADDTLAGVSYRANQSTPSVSFTYDPAYRRLTGMTDGLGTTTYTYYSIGSLGANQLESTTSPIAGAAGSDTDTVTYSYDALNRIVGYDIDGVAQSVSFDAASRITSASNALDTFTYTYADATPRVTGMSSSHGPTLAMSYYGPQGDELLEQISASQAGSALAQYGYAYNADDNVTSFSNSTPSPQTTTYAYDTVNRLLSGLIGSGTPQYAYGYDAASNLTSITANGSPQSYSYTTTNALTSGTYDANGSPTALGGNSYTWDGANRLVSFSGASGTSSTFTYDGLGRLVRVVDTTNGTVTADHSYFWCGTVRCLAHDNTQSGSPVSTQYYPQGVIENGTDYYYVQDQLGSVRELITSTGSVAAEYDYDPYGNPTTVSGTAASDIGYAGYFYHAASGLNFALYRAYDPTYARWLNRDPVGEAGGINLYAYVGGNPVSNIDPLGLWSITVGGYVGPGVEISIGTDNGYFFITGRFGLGLGGGITYDPNGGVPGGTEGSAGCTGGVLSASAEASGNVGPVGAGLEVGAERNYLLQQSNVYGGASAQVASDTWGIHVGASVGGQVTLYRPY